MTLHDLLDPIYDPASKPFSGPCWYDDDGRPMPWVGTIDDGEPVDDGAPDLSIGGEGGGE